MGLSPLDCHRHPESCHRPSFSDLLCSLKKINVMEVQSSSRQHKEDRGGYEELLQLGASLELGKNLYPDLQNSYIEQCSSDNKQ